ncbi:hypothetical protein VTK26DRAFT_3176 [Humicola hyalothermophila]
MRFIPSLTVLSLAALGLASPLDALTTPVDTAPVENVAGAIPALGGVLQTRHSPCLGHEDVDMLVDAYVRIISDWNEADAKYLASNFRDTVRSWNI